MTSARPKLELIVGGNERFDVASFVEKHPNMRLMIDEILSLANEGDVNSARGCLFELRDKAYNRGIDIPQPFIKLVERTMYRKSFRRSYQLMIQSIKNKDYKEALYHFDKVQTCTDSFGIYLDVPESLKDVKIEDVRTDTNLNRSNY